MQSAPSSGQEMSQLVDDNQQIKDQNDLSDGEDDAKDVQNHRLTTNAKHCPRIPGPLCPLVLYHPGWVSPNLSDVPLQVAPNARSQRRESDRLERLGQLLRSRHSKLPEERRRLLRPDAPDSRRERRHILVLQIRVFPL